MSVDAAEQELKGNRIEYDELPATSHYLSLEKEKGRVRVVSQ